MFCAFKKQCVRTGEVKKMFYNFCGLLGLRKSLFKLGVILCNLLVYTTMVDLSKTTVSVVVLISFTRIALEMFSLVVFVYQSNTHTIVTLVCVGWGHQGDRVTGHVMGRRIQPGLMKRMRMNCIGMSYRRMFQFNELFCVVLWPKV